MKKRRILLVVPVLLSVAAIAIGVTKTSHTWINLAPIPYEMSVPLDIAKRITVEDQAIGAEFEFMKQAYKDGAISIVSLSYQPIVGEKTSFMAAYYFNEADLDRTMNPDEVPPYGFKLIAEGGNALSVSGPQDSIFDPTSVDGKNISALHEILYDKNSYRLVR
jgi:hypothetical protein